MDRRSFLRTLLGAAPVIAVAPKYFFAPIGGWKSDVLINPPEVMFYMNPSDITRLEDIRDEAIYHNLFLDAPFLLKARQIGMSAFQDRIAWHQLKLKNEANGGYRD